MTFANLVWTSAFAICLCLAVVVYLRDKKSFVHGAFGIGMLLLAAEDAFSGLGHAALFPGDILYYEQLRVLAAALLPGTWLIFSRGFALANPRDRVASWRWGIAAVFAVPLMLATIFRDRFFAGFPVQDPGFGWLIPLDWAGYSFQIVILIASVLVLVNLERTYRASTGTMRWRIKFLLLGVASIFAVRIYASSQALLYHTIYLRVEAFNTFAILVGGALIIASLVRTRVFALDIYPSQTLIFRSITVLAVGGYLLAVAVLAKLVPYFHEDSTIPLGAFLVLLALIGLTIILLSDHLRTSFRRYISRNLKRPIYDYRRMWTDFTQGTKSVVEVSELCAVLVKIISETFRVPSVTIWLADDNAETLVLGGSTHIVAAQAREITSRSLTAGLRQELRKMRGPVDFESPDTRWPEDLKNAGDFLKAARIRYCVPLNSGDGLLGWMTLHERNENTPFSVEDFDLLRTFADQAAASLLNLKLSEHLRQVHEIEAFQNMSAFILHDLKNLASRLSLTVQNLPLHFDNPEFRSDALRVMSNCVDKINATCNRLSVIRQKIELSPREVELNEVVQAALQELQTCLKLPPVQDFHPTPRSWMDPEQIRKVLENLILNASDAVEEKGEIRISTGQQDSTVMVTVSDTGCGMTRDFLENSLFQPFRTTKKKGMGIGLFHCKLIVEAHRGRIEVESEEGKGSSFRVMLPMHEARANGN